MASCKIITGLTLSLPAESHDDALTVAPSDLRERRQSFSHRGSPPMTTDDIEQESTSIDLEDETGGRLTDVEKRAVMLNLRPEEWQSKTLTGEFRLWYASVVRKY